MTPLQYCLLLSSALFCIGLAGALARSNTILVLLGIELMLNAANLNFIAFNHYVDGHRLTGQVFSIFVIVLAAAEAAVGLAIVLAIFQTFRTIDVQETDSLRE